ncbi:MAG: hypothetical protein Ta2F_06990 [Termitinemataceae bacterium]|nr:MAG: hypothetical protein Ta2F_06990 [Termitinemataceae bacterium]
MKLKHIVRTKIMLLNAAVIFLFASCATIVKTTVSELPVDSPIGTISTTWTTIYNWQLVSERRARRRLLCETRRRYPRKSTELRNITIEKTDYEDFRHIIGKYYKRRYVYQITASGEIWQIR